MEAAKLEHLKELVANLEWVFTHPLKHTVVMQGLEKGILQDIAEAVK